MTNLQWLAMRPVLPEAPAPVEPTVTASPSAVPEAPPVSFSVREDNKLQMYLITF